MAALLDTSAAILLLRSNAPADARHLIAATRSEIAAGSAILPAVALSELVVGERQPERSRVLSAALERVPTAILPAEAASTAGAMGAFLAAEGAPIPLPDLLIAATAVWLGIPLLTWDGDYARSRSVATRGDSEHDGRKAWMRLELHPASRGA